MSHHAVNGLLLEMQLALPKVVGDWERLRPDESSAQLSLQVGPNFINLFL
jgi:hypothetical protein